MNAKEILAKVKALFEAPSFTPAAQAPGAAAAPILTPTIFKLKDGTEIGVTMSGATPAIGDMVTVAGAPAPAGDYAMEDGSVITVDATGAISVIVEAVPLTQPDFKEPVAKTLEERIAAIEGKINAPLTLAAIEGAPGLTAEMVADMYSKFAIGTTEERIGNLEVMIKALMDCNFGYQIRQGQENDAIRVYKEALTPMQTVMTAQETKLAAAEGKITKQDEVIKVMLELCEKLVGEPMTDPITLTGQKKEKFEKRAAKEDRFERIAAAMKEVKTLN